MSINRWIVKENMVYIHIFNRHNKILFLHQNNEILTFSAMWIGHLAKWNVREREKMFHDLTYKWDLKKKQTHRSKIRMVFSKDWGGGCIKSWDMLVKGYKLPVIRWTHFGDQMSNVVTIVNIGLYTWNLPRDQILSFLIIKRKCTYVKCCMC